MLAKLFQEFHPMGAAQKLADANTASRKAKRTTATYHRLKSTYRVKMGVYEEVDSQSELFRFRTCVDFFFRARVR